MHFTVRLIRTVDRDALTFVATGATELLGRMGAIAQIDFAARMGLERIRLIFKAGAIDCQVAGLATVDPGDRLVETIAIEFVHRHLLNFWNLTANRQRPDLELDVFHDSDPFVTVAGQFGQFGFNILAAALDAFDLVFKLISPGCDRFKSFVEFGLALIEFGDVIEVRLGIAFLLDRVIVLVPRFFQFALDVLDSLIGFLKLYGYASFFAFQRLESLAQFAATETGLKRRKLLRQLLIFRLGLKLFVFLSVGRFGFIVVQTIEMRLDPFPRTARNVVVPILP